MIRSTDIEDTNKGGAFLRQWSVSDSGQAICAVDAHATADVEQDTLDATTASNAKIREALAEVEAVEAVAATYYEEGDELPEGKSVGDEKTPAVEAVEAVAEVTEERPKYQGIDQSKLVPLMLAAIKELKAKVTALESA